jgi:azurin
MGLDSADTHHQANSLSYDPGGGIYLSDGLFHRTQVETATGPVRNLDAAIYRYEPRTGRFETYASYGFANPHGRSFDRWGNDLITDATGNRTYFGAAFSGRIEYPEKHPAMKTFWENPSRPSAASTILSSRHFPDDFQGNFLNGNVIKFQGVYRVKVTDDGSGLKGERLPDFLSSSDPNFRPTGIDVGPDGAVYLLDWHSPIIAHTNLNHLRDPNRGREYGRVYRITHENRALLPPPKIHGQPVAALLDLLKSPENRTRELAKVELDRHERTAVLAALKEWIGRLDSRHPEYSHHLMEALWVYQWQNVVEGDLLRRLLRSPEPEARAAATRVLSYWRDRVPGALTLLRTQAADENARVRLHAVRAASFFRSAAAVEVALTAIRHPLDYYLDYTLDETLKQLMPHWRDELREGSSLLAGDPARMRHLLRTVSNEALLKLPRSREVLELIMTRPAVPDSARSAALAELARARRMTSAEVLLGYLEGGEKVDVPAFGRLLVAQPQTDLVTVRDRLSALALKTEAKQAGAYWAALVIADDAFEGLWQQTDGSPDARTGLLTGIPMIPNATLRATAYPRIAPLIERAQSASGEKSISPAVRQAAIRAAVSTRQETSAQFSALSGMIQRGDEVAAAAAGLRALPRSSWRDADASALATALITWARKTPESSRRGAGYLGVAQLVEELTARLSPAEAAGVRKELHGLRSSWFLVRALPEEMRFDVSRLVVAGGTAFTIVFENPDAMPHNLVVVKPGTRERVGQAALELRADFVDRRGRAYVPDSSDVIAATKLLDPGQSETLRVEVPLTEGEYEYVCTFPGHWVTMWGRLVVAADPSAVSLAPEVASPASVTSKTAHQHKDE